MAISPGNQFERLDRRSFLTKFASTTIFAAIEPANAQTKAAETPEFVRISPSERPRTVVEAWNVGILTATRPQLTPSENAARNSELRHEIRLNGFGYLNIRGRYIENYGTARAKLNEEHGFLIFGNADDSGNLKGFLRKYGRKFEQDAVIHKGYYCDAHLHALKNLTDLGFADGQSRSLDHFYPDRIASYYTLMMRRGALFPPFGRLGPCDADRLGGRWEDIGLWKPTSFFNRSERHIVFENLMTA